MDRPRKTMQFKFRAPAHLAEEVSRAASERSMNISEFIRAAIREKVGLA